MKLNLSGATLPFDEWLRRLRELAGRDIAAARRNALLRLVWCESFLTSQGLASRVEDLLGRGCFGGGEPRREAGAFHRDMAAVRQALAAAGHTLAYSRRPGKSGYHVLGRPALDESLASMIAGAASEVDPRQIDIFRKLSPMERILQVDDLSSWLRQANFHRISRSGAMNL